MSLLQMSCVLSSAAYFFYRIFLKSAIVVIMTKVKM